KIRYQVRLWYHLTKRIYICLESSVLNLFCGVLYLSQLFSGPKQRKTKLAALRSRQKSAGVRNGLIQNLSVPCPYCCLFLVSPSRRHSFFKLMFYCTHIWSLLLKY
uniref:Uncharacterized protein n=1 Tax=Falco tinnunculus TaxID=100819 RepID=A0A8C4TQQ6_FALTI